MVGCNNTTYVPIYRFELGSSLQGGIEREVSMPFVEIKLFEGELSNEQTQEMI